MFCWSDLGEEGETSWNQGDYRWNWGSEKPPRCWMDMSNNNLCRGSNILTLRLKDSWARPTSNFCKCGPFVPLNGCFGSEIVFEIDQQKQVDFWTLGPQREANKGVFVCIWEPWSKKWNFYLALEIGYPSKIPWMAIISPMKLAIMINFGSWTTSHWKPHFGLAWNLGAELIGGKVQDHKGHKGRLIINCSKLVRWRNVSGDVPEKLRIRSGPIPILLVIPFDFLHRL